MNVILRAGTDIAEVREVAANSELGRLHPSTSPEAIRAAHREAVLEAVHGLPTNATDAEIAEAAVLPLSIARRHLAAIRNQGDEAPGAAAAARRTALLDRLARVIDYLRRHGPATIRDVAAALGIEARRIERVIYPASGRPNLGVQFERHGIEYNPKGSPRVLWTVREAS